MNQWWILAFVAWSVGLAGVGYNYGHDKSALTCAHGIEGQQQVTITAQKGVISTVGKQQAVTQEVDNAYQSKRNDIDSMYGPDSVQPAPAPTGDSLPATGAAACRPTASTARPLHTKIYKLSAQECDENTAQLYGLQEWVRGQQAVRQPQ